MRTLEARSSPGSAAPGFRGPHLRRQTVHLSAFETESVVHTPLSGPGICDRLSVVSRADFRYETITDTAGKHTTQSLQRAGESTATRGPEPGRNRAPAARAAQHRPPTAQVCTFSCPHNGHVQSALPNPTTPQAGQV